MGMTFNPMSVMMGQSSKSGVPYIGTGSRPTGSPVVSGQFSNPAPTQLNVLTPESVRATGTGPFDPTYRQNLATFAGGLFGRSGGNLAFNPTSSQPFGGAATGGGNAPVLGIPNTQLQNALGGNPFNYTPPSPTTANPAAVTIQDWWNQFMNQGKNLQTENQFT